ncbi:MFS transporter [Paenibacillus physcomitrellae]|uniref:MFS transporter n=1 Tax=Paenibacillus physcomitrellae TaxID=1619311 RepID=A0ABQ1FZ03_9BACL|nr:MFS transporter [Paenibacillus physcomitrellae]GGA33559.1 MFS transporter [Paenibacillus physcomitrellae]
MGLQPGNSRAALIPGRELAEGEQGRRWLTPYTICLGAFLSNLSAGMFNIALVDISGDFGVQLASSQWVVTVYLLMITICLPVMGKLGDTFGKQKVHNTGYFLFMLGALLCALAPSFSLLVVFRILQGFGASMYQATNMALIVSVYPERQRGKALGLISTFVAAGSMTGPSLGGFLIEWFSWRTNFWLLAAAALGAWLLAMKYIPKERRSGQQSLDFTGAALFAAALTGLVTALGLGGSWGWTSPAVLLLLLLFLAAAAGFMVWCRPGRWGERRWRGAGVSGSRDGQAQNKDSSLSESHADMVDSRTPVGSGAFTDSSTLEGSHAPLSRASAPFLDLDLFRDFRSSTGILITVVSYMSAFAVQLLMPVFLRTELGISPASTGLMMMGYPLALILSAPISGSRSDKQGPIPLMTSGLIVMAAALAVLGVMTPSFPPYVIVVMIVLLGAAMGMISSPNNSLVMSRAPKQQAGLVSSMLALSRNLGMMFGTAAAGSLLASGADAGSGGGAALTAYHTVFSMCALLVVVFLSLFLLASRQARRRQTEESQAAGH